MCVYVCVCVCVCVDLAHCNNKTRPNSHSLTHTRARARARTHTHTHQQNKSEKQSQRFDLEDGNRTQRIRVTGDDARIPLPPLISTLQTTLHVQTAPHYTNGGT